DQIDAVALGDQDGDILLPRGQRELLEREAAEREAAAALQSTLDAVPAHIALLDARGVIQAVNEAWPARDRPAVCRHLGLPAGDETRVRAGGVGRRDPATCEERSGADGRGAVVTRPQRCG